MTALVWNDTQSYLIPSRTIRGEYQIVSRVGGSRGRLLRAQFIAGVGVAVDLGEACITVDEAKAVAQAHHDEHELLRKLDATDRALSASIKAAAKDPTA